MWPRQRDNLRGGEEENEGNHSVVLGSTGFICAVKRGVA